jgi:hypothetical protein
MDPLTPKDPPIIISTYLQNSKPIFWKIGYQVETQHQLSWGEHLQMSHNS